MKHNIKEKRKEYKTWGPNQNPCKKKVTQPKYGIKEIGNWHTTK